jgi:hypothetical protein
MINESNVFINCPFDNQYFPLLKPLLFTVIYIDLIPQISETTDSGQTRINHIVKLMSVSKYSIHDLSRVEKISRKDYPRFNMPFECGIDFGLKASNNDEFGAKRFLILEKEPYRYKSIISDIAGNDIRSHKNDPQEIIKSIRDWFKVLQHKVPWSNTIWLAYAEFEADFELILLKNGHDPKSIYSITFSDIIENMTAWIKAFKAKKSK